MQIHKKTITLFSQSIGIFLFLSLFVISAYFYQFDFYDPMPKRVFLLIILDSIVITNLGLIFLHYLLEKNNLKKVISNVKNFLLNNLWEIIILIIFFIVQIPTIFAVQRWDGTLYMTSIKTACENIDFTLSGFINNFSGSHPTHGYYLFLSIGYFLSSGKEWGIMLMQVILSLTAIMCFYGLLKSFFPLEKKQILLTTTLLFGFSPLFFGIETLVNPDFAIVCYLIIFLYCFIKKYSVLEIFVGILLMLSKEHGAVYYIVFVSASFLFSLIQYFYYHDKQIKLKTYGIYMIPIIVFLITYYIRDYSSARWLEGMSSLVPESAKNKMVLQGIGFNGGYILEKIKQIFVLNFSWIFTLLLIAGIIMYLMKMRKKILFTIIHKKNEIGLCLVILSYIFLNCIIVTYANPRYLTINPVLFAVGSLFSLSVITHKYKIKQRILLFLCVIELVACFISVDPISYFCFQSFDTGLLKMYQPYYDNPDMYPGDLYSDNTIYNRQYTYLSSLLKKMMTELNYDGELQFMQIDMSKGQRDEGTYDYVNLMLNGMQDINTLYWDSKKNRFTEEKKTEIKTCYYFQEQILNNASEELPDSAYLILLPRQDKAILDTIQTRYVIEHQYTITCHGTAVNVYLINQKS